MEAGPAAVNSLSRERSQKYRMKASSSESISEAVCLALPQPQLWLLLSLHILGTTRGTQLFSRAFLAVGRKEVGYLRRFVLDHLSQVR